MGVRRGSTEQQIHAQLKTAAAALLAVVKTLREKGVTQLNEEALSLLSAAERRTRMIRECVGSQSVEAAAKAGSE